MITAKEIRTTIASILKDTFPDYKVYFSHVESAEDSYFYVEILPHKRLVDRVYYERQLDIAVQLVLAPVNNRVDRPKLYEAIDSLDRVFLPVIQIGDRFITVQESSSNIVDDILNYSFSLDFADFMPDDDKEHELVENLVINGLEEC